jgi:hypothetical protein
MAPDDGDLLSFCFPPPLDVVVVVVVVVASMISLPVDVNLFFCNPFELVVVNASVVNPSCSELWLGWTFINESVMTALVENKARRLLLLVVIGGAF